jgi:hypothetical protein
MVDGELVIQPTSLPFFAFMVQGLFSILLHFLFLLFGLSFTAPRSSLTALASAILIVISNNRDEAFPVTNIPRTCFFTYTHEDTALAFATKGNPFLASVTAVAKILSIGDTYITGFPNAMIDCPHGTCQQVRTFVF